MRVIFVYMFDTVRLLVGLRVNEQILCWLCLYYAIFTVMTLALSIYLHHLSLSCDLISLEE